MKNYLKKIISVEELIKKVGKFPRAKNNKIAMCHGVFDLVHPGHIRHLVFAKEKVAKLVVSVTSDMHVKKAELRPYVPQNLRAENLAALEFVDFVVKDSSELKNRLITQITSPVRWDLCQAKMVELGVTGMLELAPAGVLTGIAKREMPGVELFAVKSPEDIPGAQAFIDKHAKITR